MEHSKHASQSTVCNPHSCANLRMQCFKRASHCRRTCMLGRRILDRVRKAGDYSGWLIWVLKRNGIHITAARFSGRYPAIGGLASQCSLTIPPSVPTTLIALLVITGAGQSCTARQRTNHEWSHITPLTSTLPAENGFCNLIAWVDLLLGVAKRFILCFYEVAF